VCWQAALAYDAFGDIGTTNQELAWETPIFSGRVVPKTPSAPQDPRIFHRGTANLSDAPRPEMQAHPSAARRTADAPQACSMLLYMYETSSYPGIHTTTPVEALAMPAASHPVT
jgi:hypothetical protein